MEDASSTHPADRARRILMIVANPATSPVTGWPVGFWWSELTHPWWAFTGAGYEVTVASPRGGAVEGDFYSDPRHESGYAADDLLSLGFATSPRHAALLEDTPAVPSLDPGDFDALFLTGGQSPMVTMFDDGELHGFVARAWEAGRVVATVCHGACVLLRTRLADGSLLVEGRSWTGFADAEERASEEMAGQRIQPFWIETEARKLEDTNFITAGPFQPFAVRDGRLVTGQQQNSGTRAAELVMDVLGR
jgi:putative intracellular protease/amidase